MTASLVRSSPYTTHGWRPTSAVYQPASVAMKPLGKDRKVPHRNQRVVSSLPRQRSQWPNHDTASISSPMPTMMRKPKNGISTGGRSSRGKEVSPTWAELQSPEAMKLPSRGTVIAKRLRSLASSGHAISTSLAGCSFCQRASMAANLAG